MAGTMAEVLPPGRPSIVLAAKRLREGQLVAFPTETVYGLGANALDEAAVLSIFRAKGRPLSDPLIVHVPSTDRALDFLDLGAEAKSLFHYLADRFWPGPLTMVARATSVLPSCVSAGTGFVGLRRPAHAVAQALLEEAGVPVAAPSANRFGHVSPTSAAHVVADLGDRSVTVLDVDADNAPCAVGIESTVIGIEPKDGQLTLYRRGGVSEGQLRRALGEAPQFAALRIHAPARRASDSDGPQEAPGQLLSHYAPDVVTYLARGGEGASPACALRVPGGDYIDPGTAVAVDLGGQLACMGLRERCLAYRDLSASGSVREASRALFDALRWSEGVPGAKAVLLARVDEEGDEDAPALADRMFRAASGRVVLAEARE